MLDSPAAVMQRLADIEGQMASNENGLEAAAMDYFSAKREHDLEMAKAVLRQEGKTVDQRNAQALVEVATGDVWQKFVTSEAAYNGLKLAQESLSSRSMIGMAILRAQGRG
jgi:hypothetical protein